MLKLIVKREPGLSKFCQLVRQLFLHDLLRRYVDEKTTEKLSRSLKFALNHDPNGWLEINDAERAAHCAYRRWMASGGNQDLKNKLDSALFRCRGIYCRVVARVYRAQEEEAHK